MPVENADNLPRGVGVLLARARAEIAKREADPDYDYDFGESRNDKLRNSVFWLVAQLDRNLRNHGDRMLGAECRIGWDDENDEPIVTGLLTMLGGCIQQITGKPVRLVVDLDEDGKGCEAYLEAAD
jgi:hypothetical protein